MGTAKIDKNLTAQRKEAKDEKALKIETPADGGVTSLSPNPNRTFAQANADNSGSTQPPHSSY